MVQYAEYTSPQETHVASPQLLMPRLLRIRTSIDGLTTPMLPFALLKSDPRADFQQRISQYFQQSVNTSATPSILYDAWNAPLAALDCQQRFFICAWSAVPGISARVAQLAELIVGIATPGPLQKRWLVTGALKRQDEPVAWCVEIDMHPEIGKERVAEIVLNEGNMLRLSSVQSR